MPILLIYATSIDGERLRTWINADPAVAWIVKTAEHDRVYSWQARSTIDVLFEQEYAIWHLGSGYLNIPSGTPDRPDTMIADPFAGWTQTLDGSGATAPWFGANLPGPYSLKFRATGKEAPDSIGRSEFSWALDRYKAIGKPAHPEAKRWWFRLKRFISANATPTGWPDPATGRHKAFVFPDALAKLRTGGNRDVNP